MRKGVVIKGYKLINRLGRGSVGEVWEVEKDGQSYAMKGMILGEATTKMEEIFVQQVQLNSPFLVKYIESFHDINIDQFFVIMEYCKRGDLAKLIDRAIASKTSIELPVVMRICTQILLGLRDLHCRKIIHRDLNPHNIFVDENFITKIGDFGVAKFIATMGRANTHTGTPGYISPEIYQGKPYDESTDLWSVGVIVYQLASLALPFGVVKNSEYYSLVCCLLLSAVVNTPVAPLTATDSRPAELIRLIDWLLQKDPTKRASIDDLLCDAFVVAFARGTDVDLYPHFPSLVRLFVEAREENGRRADEYKKLQGEKDAATKEIERLKIENDAAVKESERLRMESNAAGQESEMLKKDLERLRQVLRVEKDAALKEGERLRVEKDAAVKESKILKKELEKLGKKKKKQKER